MRWLLAVVLLVPLLAQKGPALGEAEALQEIAAAIDKHGQADDFSGVVLVGRGDQVIFEKAVGYMYRNGQALNRPETLFNVGSVVKVMTKLCVGRLWSEKKLALSDTIGKFLPDYPNREAAATVTVSHLLTMTSGMGDFFGPEYRATPKDQLRNLADYLPLFAAEPLAFKPGTSDQYSNGGYIVLGLIIEKVSGMSYYDYAAKAVFEPLGMKDTGFHEVDDPIRPIATGYTRTSPDAPRRSNMYTVSQRGTSAGGAYSNVRDLFRFARGLETKKLEPKDAPEELRTGGSFMIRGGAPGVNASISVGGPGGYTVVVLANYDAPAAINMRAEISQVLRRVSR